MMGADRTMSLADVCAGLFAFVVELQAGPLESKAAEPPRYDVVSARARELLGRLDSEARTHGFGKDVVDQAKYAIVAMIDEVVLASRWSLRDEWIKRPLAAELFQEFNAGEEFFRRLEQASRGGRLDAQTVGVLEVYATCLSLGFRGMHIDVSGAERLREILYQLSKRINEGREGAPLAPHWEQKESVAASVRRLPKWTVLVGAAGVVVLVDVAFRLWLMAEAGSLHEFLTQWSKP